MNVLLGRVNYIYSINKGNKLDANFNDMGFEKNLFSQAGHNRRLRTDSLFLNAVTDNKFYTDEGKFTIQDFKI